MAIFTENGKIVLKGPQHQKSTEKSFTQNWVNAGQPLLVFWAKNFRQNSEQAVSVVNESKILQSVLPAFPRHTVNSPQILIKHYLVFQVLLFYILHIFNHFMNDWIQHGLKNTRKKHANHLMFPEINYITQKIWLQQNENTQLTAHNYLSYKATSVTYIKLPCYISPEIEAVRQRSHFRPPQNRFTMATPKHDPKCIGFQMHVPR